MSASQIAGIVIAAIIVLVIIGLVAWMQMRRRHLRDQFGPEYEHTVEAKHDRRSAERELHDREKRHREYELKPLDGRTRQRFADKWTGIQEEFVDQPDRAVADADRLITDMM